MGKDYLTDRQNGLPSNLTGQINNVLNIHGNVISSNIQQATNNSAQTNDSVYNDVDTIISAIRKEILTFNLDKEQQTELLEMANEAEKAEKEKKNTKLKTILLGIGGILKDFAVGVAASVVANKF